MTFEWILSRIKFEQRIQISKIGASSERLNEEQRERHRKRANGQQWCRYCYFYSAAIAPSANSQNRCRRQRGNKRNRRDRARMQSDNCEIKSPMNRFRLSESRIRQTTTINKVSSDNNGNKKNNSSNNNNHTYTERVKGFHSHARASDLIPS